MVLLQCPVENTAPGPRPPISKTDTLLPSSASLEEHAAPARPAPTTATSAGADAIVRVVERRMHGRVFVRLKEASAILVTGDLTRADLNMDRQIRLRSAK